MPRGDGTGPEGQGPMTGRGMGRCGPGQNPQTPNASGQPDQATFLDNILARFGMGRRRGGGRGMGQGAGRGRSGRGKF